jgi:hypothetical protein
MLVSEGHAKGIPSLMRRIPSVWLMKSLFFGGASALGAIPTSGVGKRDRPCGRLGKWCGRRGGARVRLGEKPGRQPQRYD